MEWELEQPVVLGVVADGPSRQHLVWETRFVMFAFLLPVVSSPSSCSSSMCPAIGQYHPISCHHHRPSALKSCRWRLQLPLCRSNGAAGAVASGKNGPTTGNTWSRLAKLRAGHLARIGLAAASFGAEIPVAVVLAPVFAHESSFVNRVAIGHVPSYYVLWGLAMAAITAIAEEVLVNGYLITRLGQLGWT